jgi:hypothetical protein
MEIVNNNIGFICASEAREKSNQRKGQLKQQATERIENERKDLISMVYSEIATAIAQRHTTISIVTDEAETAS